MHMHVDAAVHISPPICVQRSVVRDKIDGFFQSNECIQLTIVDNQSGYAKKGDHTGYSF